MGALIRKLYALARDGVTAGHLREVLQGGAIAFAAKLLAAGLTFLLNLSVTRALGASGAGIYFLCVTLATIAAVVARLGLDNAMLRLVAADSARGAWPEVKGMYRQGIAIAAAGAVVVTLALFFGAEWLALNCFHDPRLSRPLRIMAFSVPAMVVVVLHSELLKGIKHITASQVVYGVCVPGATLLLLYAMRPTLVVSEIAWAYTSAAVLTALAAVLLWRGYTPAMRGISGRFGIATLLGSAYPLFGASLLSLVLSWASTLILGFFGTSSEVGIYSAAERTAMLISVVLISINSIIAPKFAVLYHQGDITTLDALARRVTMVVTALALPALFAIIVGAQWIMSLYGAEFAAGGAVLIILAMGQFVNAATGSVGYLLMMSGHERVFRNCTALAAATSVIMNFTLVPAFGALGAAAATAASVTVMNLSATYYVYSRLNIVTIPVPALFSMRRIVPTR